MKRTEGPKGENDQKETITGFTISEEWIAFGRFFTYSEVQEMRIIKPSTLRRFWLTHRNAEKELAKWLLTVSRAEWIGQGATRTRIRIRGRGPTSSRLDDRHDLKSTGAGHIGPPSSRFVRRASGAWQRASRPAGH